MCPMSAILYSTTVGWGVVDRCVCVCVWRGEGRGGGNRYIRVPVSMLPNVCYLVFYNCGVWWIGVCVCVCVEGEGRDT